jgi:hypothetical protein
MALRRRGCRPEGCDTDDIFGAGAQAALLAAAADQWLMEMDIFIRRIRAPTPTSIPSSKYPSCARWLDLVWTGNR